MSAEALYVREQAACQQESTEEGKYRFFFLTVKKQIGVANEQLIIYKLHVKVRHSIDITSH